MALRAFSCALSSYRAVETPIFLRGGDHLGTKVFSWRGSDKAALRCSFGRPIIGITASALAGIALSGRNSRRTTCAHRRLFATSTLKSEPEKKYEYDLFTIGGGSGGVRASRWASQHFNARVGLAELPFGFVSSKDSEGGLGGTCVIRGCVPKKLLIYGAHFREEIKDAAGYGWSLSPEASPKLNWGTLIESKNAEIKRLNAVYDQILRDAKVDHYQGYARILDPHTVEVNGKPITTKYICIATGGRPSILQIPGANLPGVITSDKALVLSKRPKKIVILGGGYIAVEFAGLFHGYGSEVHLVYRADYPLRGFDEDVRKHLAKLLQARGIHLVSGENPVRIEKGESGSKGITLVTDKGTRVEADNVMFATGRHPSSSSVGLEEVGVKTNNKGAILVDEFSRTSVESIFAIGDVTDRIALTPVALMEGMAMVNTMFGSPTKPDYDFVPSAVFSQPPISTCGLTEKQAAIEYHSVDVYTAKFRPLKHAMPTGRAGEEMVFMKMLVVSSGFPAAGRVVGLHIVGADAPEMMQGFAVSMKAGSTKADFDATVGIHPTSSEEICTMRSIARTTTKKDALKM